jgi:hypothetical protein
MNLTDAQRIVFTIGIEPSGKPATKALWAFNQATGSAGGHDSGFNGRI